MPYKPGTSYIVTEEDCENAFEQCRACPFVSKNPTYKEVSEGIFLTVAEGDEVNAYMLALNDKWRKTLRKTYPEPVDWGEYTHLIEVSTGMLRWVTVLAHVCEYIDRTKNLREAKAMLKMATERLTSYEAGSDFVQRFLDEFKVTRDGRRDEVVRMYALATLIAIIGHEMGHACLGHCGGINRNSQNSITRNDERCADMFSSSVTQSIGNGFAGAVASAIMFVGYLWLFGKHNYATTEQEVKKPRMFETHPVTLERFNGMIDSFNTMLATSPITAKMLKSLAKGG